MRVLVVAFPEAGHRNPMTCVAQRLVRDGHDVQVLTMEEAGDARPARGRDLVNLLERPALARRWFRYVLTTQVPLQLAALREAIGRVPPEVIVTDPLAYAGAIVAEQLRVPWAAVSTQLLALAPPELRWPYLDYLEDPILVRDRDRLLAAEGVALRFERGEAVSPWLFTVFATEALAVAGCRIPHAILVGPASPLGAHDAVFPWDRLREGVPLVYVSFGSQLAPDAATCEAICAALDPAEADLVLASGEPPTVPPHVITVPWAPQLALLERARVMITHGGANSIAECLRRGVPALVIPLINDQPLQAHLIERAGAGIALAPAAVTAASIRTALCALLADGPQRRRAAELGRSYAAGDGAERVAELVVALAQ